MGLVRSELLLQFISSGFAVAEDLREQTATDRLPPVDRNDRATSVGMLQEVVAALRPYDRKTKLPKGLEWWLPFVLTTANPSFRRALISWLPVTAAKPLMR